MTIYLSSNLPNLRIEKKLSASNKGNQSDHRWNDHVQNTIYLIIQEAYLTKVSEEIDGKVTKEQF